MRPRCALLAALLLFLAGCGNIAYETRYLPRSSELSWDEEIEQLPWQPPMADDPVYPIIRDPALPPEPVHPIQRQESGQMIKAGTWSSTRTR